MTHPHLQSVMSYIGSIKTEKKSKASRENGKKNNGKKKKKVIHKAKRKPLDPTDSIV